MTEQEALKDLVSSEGWSYVVQHMQTDLQGSATRIINAAGSTDATELGWQIKSHATLVATIHQIIQWPKKRAAELEGRESRPVVVDMRGVG